ncbi:DUF6493 family protein [Streptomyces sp. NPDC059524]|uniref:DUF7824 domain-containing protein n=1 Tax=Streptomyces sp. NPDC059524 TaxID=3346856 RepID=UPI003689E111
MGAGKLLAAVRAGRVAEVADLLDGLSDAERRACLPGLKELRKELREGPWDSEARKAYPALQLAGAACHTGAAAAAAWLGASEWVWQRHVAPRVLLHLLAGREAAWLADVAHRLAALPASRGVSYELMAGLVELAGCPVPVTESYVVGWVGSLNAGRRTDRSLADRLRTEPHVAELTAALFETEDIGGRLDWFPSDSAQSWPRALAELARGEVLERKVLLDGCVARLLRGGRPSDLRLFLKVLDALAPDRDEESERVADWAAMCSDGSSPVAAHAQKVLGGLALAGVLPVRTLAEVSGAVLFRTEKKLVRAQLVLLGKVLRSRAGAGDPPVEDVLLPAVGEAFGHADTEVQERALKLVARHVGAADPATREVLVEAAAQLTPGLRPLAEETLGVELAPEEPYTELLPLMQEPFRLAAAPDAAAEVAEEVGAILASGGDVSAFERTLDGLVRHAFRDREGLAAALAPVVARCWWSGADTYGRVQGAFRESTYGLEVVAASVVEVLHLRTLRHGAEHGHEVRADRSDRALQRCYDARLWEVAYRIRTRPVPFLLATPTWSTGFIEPGELVERLRTYRDTGARAGAADLAQALLRVDRSDARAAADAATSAAALGTREGDRLAAWLAAPPAQGPTATLWPAVGRVLVELREDRELQEELPAPFQRLGLPLVAVDDIRAYWWGDSGAGTTGGHLLAALPGRREAVAARLLGELSSCAVEGSRGVTAYLPLLAEAPGAAGPAVHLSVVYGLAARHAEDRLAGVDALLILAARDELDAGLLGSLTARVWEAGGVRLTRLADALGTAASTGAYGTVFGVLRGLLPTLLASGEPPTALRGLGDLLSVAADCAERTGAHEPVSGLTEVAERRSSSQLVTQARRLRTALGGRTKLP